VAALKSVRQRPHDAGGSQHETAVIVIEACISTTLVGRGKDLMAATRSGSCSQSVAAALKGASVDPAAGPPLLSPLVTTWA
jgi:hypothetical protein